MMFLKLWRKLVMVWHLVNHYDDDLLTMKKAVENLSATIDQHRSITNSRLDQHETVILNARDEIVRRTTVNADVHVKEQSSDIIVVGRYRGCEYVRIFSVRHSDTDYLVDQLKGMEQRHLGRIRRIDAPLGFREFFIKRD